MARYDADDLQSHCRHCQHMVTERYREMPVQLTKDSDEPSLCVRQYPPQHFLQTFCVRSMHSSH